MTELYVLAVDEPGAVPGGFAAALRAMYGDALPAEAANLGRLSADAAERLGLLMAREVVGLAERFVVMSECAAALVRADVPDESGDKISTVPFGMPAPRVDAMPANERECLVVTVGVVNEVKQTSLLLEALPQLLERQPDARLAVVGRCSDDDRDRLVALATMLGVADRVTVTGEVDEPSYRSWLDRAAVAVQLRRTSNGECSAAVADCFSSGVPVVLTDIGANRDLPIAVAAKVSPYVTERELANVVADLLADVRGRAAMVMAGAEYARVSSFAVAAERLFTDVIAAEPPTRWSPVQAGCARSAMLRSGGRHGAWRELCRGIHMPKCVRCTAATASAGPVTSTCAARCRPKTYRSSSPGSPVSRAVGSPGRTLQSLVRSGPLDLEPGIAETTTEVAATSTDVSPQRGLQLGCERARVHPVGPPHVFVMNEELVQVGKRTDPADAEEPRRRARPDPRHEPPEVAAFRESYPAAARRSAGTDPGAQGRGRRADRARAARCVRRGRARSIPRAEWPRTAPTHRTRRTASVAPARRTRHRRNRLRSAHTQVDRSSSVGASADRRLVLGRFPGVLDPSQRLGP